ncbi:MAG TPA: hypothetical protein VFD74_00840 [Thermoleophilia bacterium]|nr:hypothetical protein [Thermoleophilia bacterium]
MSIGWLSALAFPLLTSFFGCGMFGLLERDRRLGIVAVASLVAMAILVAASFWAGPPDLRAAIVRF